MDENIRAILIDDEPYCTAGLEIELKENCPQVDIIAICNSAKEGLKKIKELSPDVVFLDIEMPWMNGFELLELLSPIEFGVIFITAYDQFAVQAFRISAIDYLMKPIDKNMLIDAVGRIKKSTNEKTIHGLKLSQLLKNIKNPIQANPKISLPRIDGIDLVAINSIIYCKADSSYTEFYLIDGTKKMVCKVLKEIEFQLEPFEFLRIHQSYIVNMDHVVSFHRSDGGFVEMINGDKVSISRSKKRMLIERLKS